MLEWTILAFRAVVLLREILFQRQSFNDVVIFYQRLWTRTLSRLLRLLSLQLVKCLVQWLGKIWSHDDRFVVSSMSLTHPFSALLGQVAWYDADKAVNLLLWKLNLNLGFEFGLCRLEPLLACMVGDWAISQLLTLVRSPSLATLDSRCLTTYLRASLEHLWLSNHYLWVLEAFHASMVTCTFAWELANVGWLI